MGWLCVISEAHIDADAEFYSIFVSCRHFHFSEKERGKREPHRHQIGLHICSGEIGNRDLKKSKTGRNKWVCEKGTVLGLSQPQLQLSKKRKQCSEITIDKQEERNHRNGKTREKQAGKNKQTAAKITQKYIWFPTNKTKWTCWNSTITQACKW